jgi:ComF family protein
MKTERRSSEMVEALVGRVARLALGLVFPLHCIGCHREGAVICERCVAGLKRLEKPYCDKCARPNPSPICSGCLERPLAVDTIRAPFLFEGPIREAVHRLKYRGQRAAATQLAQLMAESAARSVASVDVITPVPLHPSRLRKRGYNQSFLLARELGKILGLPVQDGLLSKVKNSPPQVETPSREERQSNVAGSFECRRPADDLRVLLIDDVATTGSTLSECAATLKAAGAKAASGLVLARES